MTLVDKLFSRGPDLVHGAYGVGSDTPNPTCELNKEYLLIPGEHFVVARGNVGEESHELWCSCY